jgi:hypothetical protein
VQRCSRVPLPPGAPAQPRTRSRRTCVASVVPPVDLVLVSSCLQEAAAPPPEPARRRRVLARPPSAPAGGSERVAGEIGDQVRRRGVEADDVEHPGRRSCGRPREGESLRGVLSTITSERTRP